MDMNKFTGDFNHRLCETCGSFWPNYARGECCCGHPVLDPKLVHRVVYKDGAIVKQGDYDLQEEKWLH